MPEKVCADVSQPDTPDDLIPNLIELIRSRSEEGEEINTAIDSQSEEKQRASDIYDQAYNDAVAAKDGVMIVRDMYLAAFSAANRSSLPEHQREVQHMVYNFRIKQEEAAKAMEKLNATLQHYKMAIGRFGELSRELETVLQARQEAQSKFVSVSQIYLSTDELNQYEVEYTLVPVPGMEGKAIMEIEMPRMFVTVLLVLPLLTRGSSLAARYHLHTQWQRERSERSETPVPRCRHYPIQRCE